MQLTEEAFQAARLELTNYIVEEALNLSWTHRIGYHETADAPDTYEKLVSAYEAARTDPWSLPVWNGASDGTVYLWSEANYAFRFVHDLVHVHQGLTFSASDELQVAIHHQHLAVLAGVSSLARRLLWADTQGENNYLAATGSFPENQLAFVRDYVTAELSNQPFDVKACGR